MSDEKITSKKAFSNMIWRFAERFGAQTVSFMVSVLIARILDPDAYGIVAIVGVFNTILFVFVDSGLGNALIQKKDSDDRDFSTVFYANLALCIVLYIALFFSAPLIARFYNNQNLIALVRVSGITLLLSGIKNVQQAYVTKHLIFKKFFFATLAGTLGSAFVGLWMALAGYGVWALVASSLFNSTVDMIVLWITVKWRPIRFFSFERLKSLFSYGSKILLANVTQAIYSNIYDLIIGKVYSSADLAFYNKGKQIPLLVVNNTDDAINSVLLPVMSNSQDSIQEIKKMSKRALKTNFYFMTPALIGLAAIAEPLVMVLLTEKWMSAVIYLHIFAIIQIFRPISTTNLNAIKALGRSDLFFNLEIWKDACGLTFLLLTVNRGVFAIAIGVMLNSFVCQVINSWPSKKLFDYSLLEQMMDVLPILLLSLFMASIVFSVNYLHISDLLKLCIQIPLGAVIYILGSKLFHIESYQYAIGLLKQFRKSR